MPTSRGEERVLHGTVAAPGQALGPVLVYAPVLPPPPAAPIAPAAVPAEQARAATALAAAGADLDQLAARTAATIGPSEAAIFTAQALMVADPLLGERVTALIAERHLSAEGAILAATAEQADLLAALDDAYLRERAADLHDIGARAARLASGAPPPADLAHLPAPVLILAADLSPSETIGLDRAHVLGIGLAGGGPTSHAAVVARALGVPLVCGLGPLPAAAGRQALLDGDAGLLVVDPGPARVAVYRAWQGAGRRALAADAALRDLPAVTPDGHRVRLLANAGAVADATAAAAHGAEGIGLLRTEFLFLDHAPDEAEQVAAYGQIYAALPDREIIVRTMDLGGDKPPPYLDFGAEANPFLGWRGIRVALDRPDLLRTQVRAVLRAGAGRPVHLMFPMVTTLEELRRARAVVATARADLAREGLPAAGDVQVGIMIEVPAAALLARAFAAEADFFSIGTNDLTQYTLAADRGAARVAALYSPLQPAVLGLIARTVEGAHALGRPVGLCGEAAANPAWTPLWLGLGLDELSMAAAAIPAVKRVIRETPWAAAQALAHRALAQVTLAEVAATLADAASGDAPAAGAATEQDGNSR